MPFTASAKRSRKEPTRSGPVGHRGEDFESNAIEIPAARYAEARKPHGEDLRYSKKWSSRGYYPQNAWMSWVRTYHIRYHFPTFSKDSSEISSEKVCRLAQTPGNSQEFRRKSDGRICLSNKDL
jgi:hypothetical protein